MIKNQKGFGLVEVIVFGIILSITVMIYTSWSKILKRSISNMDQKINLETSDMIINKYLDCCRTYKNYFGESTYPGNVPLHDSDFINGPITLYDAGDNQLLEFTKPWFIVGMPGGSALEINYSETRPNKDYLSRDVSTTKSREQFSGKLKNLKCDYTIDCCSSGTSTSSGGGPSTSTSTSTGSSSSSSSSSTGGTGSSPTGSSGTSSSSSSSSSASSSGYATPTSTSDNSSSSSSGSGTGSSSSSGSSGNTATSSSGSGSTGSPSSSSSGGSCGGGSCMDCPYPTLATACSIPPCFGPNCPTCQNLCQIALDNANNPGNGQGTNCLSAGCNAGGQGNCACMGSNQALCMAGKWLAAAQACHADVSVVNCWMQRQQCLQDQVFNCSNCCTANYCDKCACIEN